MTRELEMMVWAFIVGCAIALVWLASMAPALAHQAASGMFVYPSGCCNSAKTSPTGDCDTIAPSTVEARSDGYHISLQVGQHPKLLNRGYRGVVPYSDTKDSPDGQFHVCLSTDGANRYCFFAPPPGV